MYDLAIIGAGPAGATLARLVAHRYRVLLIDRRPGGPTAQPNHRSKCCGGLLAPDAQKSLAQLGLGVPKSVLVGPQLFVVRAIDLEQAREGFYQRHYLNINRAAFDEWLVSLLPAGVDFRPGWSFKSYERTSLGFKIHFTTAGKPYTETARVLIGADGGCSTVRRRAYPQLAWPHSYLAIQEWFQSSTPLPYFSAFFDSRWTDFYGWVIPKEDTLVVGAALAPGTRAPACFEQFKQQLLHLGYDLRRKLKQEGAWLARPLNNRQIVTGNQGILLIGEAAGWISPSSAEGLSYAFNSAINLSQSIATDLVGLEDRYRCRSRKMRLRITCKRWKALVIYQPRLRGFLLKWGIKQVKIVP